MKIVHMVDSLRVGGAQKLLITMVEAYREFYGDAVFLDIQIISLSDDRNKIMFEELKSHGITIVNFPSSIKFGLLDVSRYRKIVQYLRREHFDILHSHLSYSNIIGALCSWLSQIPMVASLHNVSSDSRDSALVRFLQISALRKVARRIIAVGNTVAESYQKYFPDQRIDVIPNAVRKFPEISSLNRLKMRKLLVPEPSQPILIAVGRLTEQKGYMVLLEAFAQVIITQPCFLLIVGDGQLREELLSEINRLNLDSRVFLLGLRDDIPNLLAASDVFVSSSFWEGLPVALLEAMSAGLPVVATQVGENDYVVPSDAGILVPPKDPIALSKGLLEMLLSSDFRVSAGLHAKAYVNQLYDAETWLRNILNIYSEILKSASEVIEVSG